MLLLGDALQQLRRLEAESIHTCVTSPPYYNLRDYGINGQIGTESTPGGIYRKTRGCIPRGAAGAAPGRDVVGEHWRQLCYEIRKATTKEHAQFVRSYRKANACWI